MKKILVSLAMVLVGFSAFAQSASIEGNWGVQQQAGELFFDLTFSVGKSSVTLTNTCSGFGQTLTVQVTAKSVYTDNTFTVLESVQDQKFANGLSCDVSVQPDTMGYSVQGNQLILTHPGTTDTLVLYKK